MTTTATTPAVHIRWAAAKDYPALRPFLPPGWTLAKLRRYQGMKTVIALVAEVNEKAVGLLVYRLCTGSLRLLALAVNPRHRRRGVASALLRRLAYRVGTHRRPKAVAWVRERNLPAQLTLRSAGWVCLNTQADKYADGEGGLLFERAVTAGDDRHPSR